VESARHQRMLAPLSAREREQLERITRKLLAHLSQAESSGSRPA
jgi:DNA-binding MarR family transcriptional regulator